MSGEQASPRARPAFAPRLRRRVALAFAGAIALTVIVLALSSYFLVKASQEGDALDRALSQSRFNLSFARTLLPEEPSSADFDRLLQALALRGGFESLIEQGGEQYVSGPQVRADLVSPALRTAVAEGRLAYQPVTLGGEPGIAVGGRIPPGGPDLYFFYSLAPEGATLARLRIVLAVGGLILALAGVAAGWWLASRILGPVAAAARAAARMAAGDLSTRLPTGPGEFGALNASFNTMAANLQAKLADLEEARARERRFTADVAHELRTPVAALVGEASLLEYRLAELQTGRLSPDSIRTAELIQADIARLHRLVEDLLEISRIDAQAAEVEPEEIELYDFLRRMRAGRGWPPEVLVRDGETISFLTDRRRFERIVSNLVDNALHHGAPPVVISPRVVDLSAGSRALELTVADRGPGIPAEHAEHVFDRFYKVDPSRGATRGTGLGLAIAWENARLLGGSLELDCAGGEGTTFRLLLPL